MKVKCVRCNSILDIPYSELKKCILNNKPFGCSSYSFHNRTLIKLLHPNETVVNLYKRLKFIWEPEFKQVLEYNFSIGNFREGLIRELGLFRTFVEDIIKYHYPDRLNLTKLQLSTGFGMNSKDSIIKRTHTQDLLCTGLRNPKIRDKSVATNISNKTGIYNPQNSFNGWGYKGFYFSNKSGIVFHASYTELFTFILLDRDETVSYYIVQPDYWISYLWSETGKIHKYKPDILVVYIDGSVELLECKLDKDCNKQQNIDKWKAAKLNCLENNMTFKVITNSSLRNLIL